MKQMRKAAPMLIMVLALVVCVMTLSPRANAQTVSGDWTYEAYGEGIVLKAYNGTATDVYVPSRIDDKPVIKLGDGLFQNNDALNSVTLGAGIIEIGAKAFYDCDNLVCIVTNEQLTTIGDEAFYSCNAFNSVILYDSVTTLGKGVFAGCLRVTVWCNENSAAYDYAIDHSVSYEILNPDAAPEIHVLEDITYYIMNGEAIAIDCDDNATKVVMPTVVEGYPVTQLRETFRDCNRLTEVVLPEGLRIISSYAFYNCYELLGITVPDSVSSIGQYAFYNCYSMKYANIGTNVTDIGDFAFDNCDGLTEIRIPDSVVALGNSTFVYCDRLETVVIGNGVQAIGEKAFYSCKALSDVTIGDGVTSIGSFAFYNCTGLKSITIPGNVTDIGHAAFSECNQLENVTLSEGVSTIGSFCFDNCSSLEEVILPISMQRIEECLFYNCTMLISVEIPDGVTAIGNSAFYNCQSLASVTLPEGLTAIGKSAFDKCYNLSKIAIPESVENMYVSSFLGNCVLMIYADSFAQQYADANGIFYVLYDGTNEPIVAKLDGVTYCLTDGKAIAIDFDNSIAQLVIPEAVQNYPVTDLRETFRDCTMLTSVTLPRSIKKIGKYTFYNCSGLTSVKLQEGVMEIGERAFSECSSLTSVTIPQSVTKIGSSAFSFCSALTAIEIPNQVTAIGDYTFSSCTSLVSVSLPDTLRSIGISAFINCDSLVSVVIPDLVTSIGENAFNGCDGLKFLIIGSGVTTMGDQAFYMCRKLETVKIEEGATVIGVSAFYNCDSLTSVVIPDSVINMGNNAFANCYALTSVTIGNGITKINYSTFARCESLTEVKFGENVTIIGDGAFDGCSSLTQVTIPEGVTSIEGYAFRCENMNKVVIPKSVTNLSTYAFPDTTILLVYEGSAAYDTATRNDLLHFVYDGAEEPLVVRQDGVTYCVMNEQAIAINFDNTKTSVTIPATVEGYPVVELRETFNGCKKLTSVVLPEGLQIIGSNAFLYCSKLTSVTIPDSVTTIGSSAFSYCSALTTVDMGAGVTLIDAGAFSRCSKLTCIEIPNGVTHIGTTAFYQCSNLTQITIPKSVTDIGGLAFQDCSKLASVIIPDNVVNMGSSVFSGCDALTTVVIGDGIKKIQSSAFNDCGQLKSVIIGKNVTSIAASAFAKCNNLRQIIIPETVTSLKANSFATNTILIVCKDSYAHTFAANNNLLYFVIHKGQNPEISYGAAISGRATYMDGAVAAGAAVEILYDDGTVKESVTTDASGAYAFTYAEVGRYTIRVTDAAGNTASTVVSVKRMNAFDVFLAGDTNLTMKRGWSVSGGVSEAAIVTITDSKGNVLSTVETIDGSFVFANIPNGTYVLKAQTANSSIAKEITVFNGDLSGIILEIPKQIATVWGYTEVENRDGTASRRNWVNVTLYDAQGLVIAQTKTDKDGMFRFENLPLGSYRLAAEAAEFRPDHHGRPFDRSYTLTGFAYADASVAGERRADILMKEVHAQETDFSGKVTAHGQTQNSEVILRDVEGNEYARYITGKNGKFEFINIPDGVYIITAITPAKGMGYTVVTIRDSVIYGNTDITVYKDGKLTQQEMDFYADLGQCDSVEDAKNLRNRIAEEKRLFDSLSQKEKKQLSKEYVEMLNRLVEWTVACEYTTPDGVEMSNGGTVVSGDELENSDSVSFHLTVEKLEEMQAGENGVENADDYIYYDMQDTAGSSDICQYFEISMTMTVDAHEKTITSVSKDTDTTGKFRITMPIPEAYRGHKHYTMLHVHNGETVVLADLDDNPDTITFEVDGFSTFALTAADEVLIPVAHAQIWQDAELYGNYISLEEAVNGYDSTSQYVKLVEDTAANLNLTQDLYIDLNGYDLTGIIVTNGYKVYGMDSTTNGYTCENMGYFSCTDENGEAIVPEKLTAGNMRYMCIATDKGYTFHRFFLGITHISLKPSVTGFGYKAEFYGDEMVQSQVVSLGYNLWLTENHVVSRSKAGFQSTLTLRLQNFDVENYGNAPVSACVIMTLADGTVIGSAVQSCTLRSAVEAVNANYAQYTVEQLAAVSKMIQAQPAMQSWNVENIYKKETV